MIFWESQSLLLQCMRKTFIRPKRIAVFNPNYIIYIYIYAPIYIHIYVRIHNGFLCGIWPSSPKNPNFLLFCFPDNYLQGQWDCSVISVYCTSLMNWGPLPDSMLMWKKTTNSTESSFDNPHASYVHKCALYTRGHMHTHIPTHTCTHHQQQ